MRKCYGRWNDVKSSIAVFQEEQTNIARNDKDKQGYGLNAYVQDQNGNDRLLSFHLDCYSQLKCMISCSQDDNQDDYYSAKIVKVDIQSLRQLLTGKDTKINGETFTLKEL